MPTATESRTLWTRSRRPFPNGFSDVGLGGGTTGSIATRGGQALTIVDSPNAAEGVVITAVDATGTNAAIIHIDGQPSDITLRNDSVAATHGSLILRVIAGVVGVTYRTDDGQTVATASLSAGTTLTYKPETVTFIATATPTAAPTEVILIGSTGQQATADLSAGSQITFDSQAFTFTAPATNPAPVTVTVNGAPVPVTPGSSIRPVAIDIKPGDATNTLNLDSSGVIQVAIYSTLGFDASKIGVLGPVRRAHAVQSSLVDVNGDGRKDLLLNFRTQDTA